MSHHYLKLDLRFLQTILRENGGVMICTRSAAKRPQIMQTRPEDGKFVVVEIDKDSPGSDVKRQNSSAFTTLCRHAIE